MRGTQTEGPHRRVVWFPRIEPLDEGTNVASYTLGRAGGAVYGRITSSARLENVVGQPQYDELVRGPRVVLVEEV